MRSLHLIKSSFLAVSVFCVIPAGAQSEAKKQNLSAQILGQWESVNLVEDGAQDPITSIQFTFSSKWIVNVRTVAIGGQVDDRIGTYMYDGEVVTLTIEGQSRSYKTAFLNGGLVLSAFLTEQDERARIFSGTPIPKGIRFKKMK